MQIESLTIRTKRMIDDLKTICANFGLGGSPGEYKIITQVFLYKYLNDKFFYQVSLGFILFCLIPAIIALIWLVKSMIDEIQNRYLFGICICVILTLTIAALCGKLVFITKYSMEIYPILIFMIAYGAGSFNNKILKYRPK